LFETIAIDTEEIDGHELAPPFAQLGAQSSRVVVDGAQRARRRCRLALMMAG
jgi:hypothetical protein